MSSPTTYKQVVSGLKIIIHNFRLLQEKERYETVHESISSGIHFRGTNLWILIFAIFIASLGLNVNSTAVIIGAMLISPLMGPIMGIGLGLGTGDLVLLKKSLFNFVLATSVALITSTIYFLLSPLNQAHSEILARTAPNAYDVLIAFFGGLAGILVHSSKNKGNVIPGVAIATALMPPLCTAGFGLASLNMNYFLGAFYLYFINAVFISLATLITVRWLGFPVISMGDDEVATVRVKRIVAGVTVLTVLPSIYFAYDIIRQERFMHEANQFIDREASFENDYLLERRIDPRTHTIALTFGGRPITEEEIAMLDRKRSIYHLDKAKLIVNQGFSTIIESSDKSDLLRLRESLIKSELTTKRLQYQLDSLKNRNTTGVKVFDELKVFYPTLDSAIIQPVLLIRSDSANRQNWFIQLHSKKALSVAERASISSWLEKRLEDKRLLIHYSPSP